MAITIRSWTGKNSTDWTDPGNWDTGVPASTDDVIINTTPPNSPSLGTSETVNSITNVGADTLTLSGAATVLTVTNGINLDATGGISGFGKIASSVTAFNASTIAASGGQLEVTGAIVDSGNKLNLEIFGGTDALVLDASATAKSVSFNGASGALVVNNIAGTLTVGTPMAIGSGSLFLQGPLATLNDASGVTLDTGFIVGPGIVAAAVTATGKGTIGASGKSVLEVTGAITDTHNSLTLEINPGSTLLLDAPSAAQFVDFTGAGGTLELGNGATLTLGTQLALGSGSLNFDAVGTVTDGSGITLTTGTIGGHSGTVAASVTASDAGTIEAVSGRLEVTGAVIDNGGKLNLKIGLAGKLLLDGPSAAQSAIFTGATGYLGLGLNASLTLGSQLALGSGSSLLLEGPAATLTDKSGITLFGAISGLGKVAAAVTASNGSIITADHGQLEVTGPISGDGTVNLEIFGDTASLVLDGPSAAHSVTFDQASGALVLNPTGSLTVGEQMAIGSGSVFLQGPAATLSDGNGVTLGSGFIVGPGKVAAAVTATGKGTIGASGGGILEVTGAIIDSGKALTLEINPGSTLLLDAASGSGAQYVDFTGAGGTLELGSNVPLTLGTQLALGNNTLKLDDAQINDTAGITLGNTGTVTGLGFVNAGLSGGGTVQVSGGSLYLFGTVASGPTLAIADVAHSVLKIFNTATAAAPITLDTGNKTLAIQVGGNLTINGGAESVTNGAGISMRGGQLSDSAGFTLGSGAVLSGFGKVTGPISGAPFVEANFGTLELVDALPASPGSAFLIGALATLMLDATPGSGDQFTFLSPSGDLALADAIGFNGTISGLNVGVGGVKTSFVDVLNKKVTISSVTGQGSTGGTITLSDGAVLNLTNLSAKNWAANAVSDGATGTDIFVSDTPCFCHGTLILTERGEVAVEELAVGDRVRTLSGAAKPIVWIGMGSSLVTRANKLARPIIVRQGALADGVPHRDLYLTHGHALYLDGALIPVENLVNHRSIVWDERARVVEYYHIELEDHDAVLANGAAAESYYDANNRAQFHNTRVGSTPGAVKPAFAPVLNGGALVERAWAALFERSGGRITADATDEPDLHLVIDGERLDPASFEHCVYTFTVRAPPAGALRLVSRSGIPSLLGLTSHDHRRLGVAISRIDLRQSGILTAFGCENALFVEGGCHPAENRYSWTDGDLALPAQLFLHLTGAFTLAVHTERPGMRYPIEPMTAMAA